MTKRKKLKNKMLKFLKQFPEVLAVMSEKSDGTMRLLGDGANRENRNRFFEKAGIDIRQAVGAKLENGNNVKIIFDSQENIINQTDALITKKKNIFLSISVADCIPVFFYESQAKIIGLAHAGWRGIAGGVIENTMKKITELGGMAENLKIALGPGINKCHFEVGEEVVDKFKNYKEYIFKKDKKYFIDLRGIIKKKLNKLGVKSENIEDCNICTFCSKNLFSFRRDKPKMVEAMVAVIGMRE
ncbi:peptidoglycan editing factor PgeF [Candidatus Falkowbacteria bacterium CG_4_9_14_3_um_filter_36_9]|nr:MAG: peptidoglycan editing factor PgeF [Candidatus Falkowbacteria bacterium CG_4_9_14_3_um_filter_36_9]